MFWLSYQNRYHLTIFCESDQMSCALFQQTDIYHLSAYTIYPYDTPGTMPSLSQFRCHINTFIQKENIKNPFTHLILTRPFIIDDLLFLPTSQPTIHDIAIAQIEKFIWCYEYLYTTHAGSFCIYITAIRREQLSAWQLRLMHASTMTSSIIGSHTALLSFYRYFKGSSFRHTQLGIDLIDCDHEITKLLLKNSYPFVTADAQIVAPFRLEPHLGAIIHATQWV